MNLHETYKEYQQLKKIVDAKEGEAANSRCPASTGSATFEQYKRSSDDTVCKFTAHECDSLDYFMQNGLLMHRRDGETFITDQSGNENHLKQNKKDNHG